MVCLCLYVCLFVCLCDIPRFMVQTGDPTGTGKGGMSCWGKKMEDELVDSLKVWCVVCVCMFVCVFV